MSSPSSHILREAHRTDAPSEVLLLVVVLHVAQSLGLLPAHAGIHSVQRDAVLQAVIARHSIAEAAERV